MAKKATFTDICNYMIQKAKENKGKPHGHGGGGDACCGGEEAPPTPDAIVAQYLPKLVTTLIEILGDAPFNGESTMQNKNDEGKPINFKSEMILKTILAWTISVLGGSLHQKRKISLEASANEVSVRCEKLPFLKQENSSSIPRTFVALVNLTDDSMYIQEISKDDAIVVAKFKIKVGAAEGKRNFKAYVMSGDGHIETGKEMSG